MKKYILSAMLMTGALLSAGESPRPYEIQLVEYSQIERMDLQGKPGERDDAGYLRPKGRDNDIVDPAP